MNRVGSGRRPCFVSLGALDVMGGRKGSGIEGGKNRRGRGKETMPVMEKSLMSGEGENAGDGEDGINIRLVRSEKMDPPTWLLITISAKIEPPSLIPNV